MVEGNKIDNVFERNFPTGLKFENGIPIISPWSTFSILKKNKTVKDYSLSPEIFKIWIDENSMINFNIRVEKINKKWPNGELTFVLEVMDANYNLLIEVVDTFENKDGKDAKKKKKVARPWDFLMPGTEYVSSLTAKERMDICRGCEKLHANVCQECGCLMPLKTKLVHAECPLGKWLAENSAK